MLWDGNGLVGKRVETVREPGPNRPRLISANPDYTPITRCGRKRAMSRPMLKSAR